MGFFDDTAGTTPEGEAEQAGTIIEKIKIGDEEFEPNEANELIKLGKIGREANEKYNTSIEKVWPEYTKTRQDFKELKERTDAEEKARMAVKEQAGEELTEEEQGKRVLESARKYGLVTKQDFDQYYVQRREAEKVLDNCSDLQEEIDGLDGRPPFKTKEILTYMEETGIRNPELAYKTKFEKEIDKWKDDQLKNVKPKGLTTEEASPAGTKVPPEIKIKGEEDLRRAINEQLYGGRGE